MQSSMLCCPRCGGTFLDALSGAIVRVDFGAAFGVHARGTSASTRRCPVHNAPMNAVQVECAGGISVVHRSVCCTGVFLDAGQAHQLSAPRGGGGVSGPPPGFPGAASGPPPGFPGASAPPPPPPPAQFASRAPAAGHITPTCPSCNIPTQFEHLNGVDVDACAQCAHVFFEKGEPERAGIDTEAIFAEGSWAAPRGTNADIPCVLGHGGAMVHYRGSSLAGDFDAYFSTCCHGVWVATAEVPRLRAAARKAVYDRAEFQAMSGMKVQKTRAQTTPEEQRQAEFAKVATGMMRDSVTRSKEAIEEQRRRRRERADRALRGSIIADLAND